MLELRGVCKTYANAQNESKHALLPTDLTIAKGTFIALVGPSGCGKTTLLKMVAGLVSMTEGVMTLDGRTTAIPPDNMGMVFQQPALLPWRSVMKNLLLPSQVMGKDRDIARTRARKLLAQVGLDEDGRQFPGELSGGMQQRVAIARALVQDPDILLMDEPFSALDAITREDLGKILESLLVEADKTVLFVTHSISEAALLADRIIVISPSPGEVTADIAVDIPRPRDVKDRDTAAALAVVEARVRTVMDDGAVSRTVRS